MTKALQDLRSIIILYRMENKTETSETVGGAPSKAPLTTFEVRAIKKILYFVWIPIAFDTHYG